MVLCSSVSFFFKFIFLIYILYYDIWRYGVRPVSGFDYPFAFFFFLFRNCDWWTLSRDFAPRIKMAHFFFFKCYFTSTETIRTIWDGEPRTATSTFTQLLSSLKISGPRSMSLYGHKDSKDYYGQGAQDSHLDFRTAPKL